MTKNVTAHLGCAQVHPRAKALTGMVPPGVIACSLRLARAIREDARVLQGASTRALVLMMPALQARALLHGRDYVGPDDQDFIQRIEEREKAGTPGVLQTLKAGLVFQIKDRVGVDVQLGKCGTASMIEAKIG